MSTLLTSTALLLLAAAPATGAPSSSRDFRLHEGLPAGFQVDGKLDEWKGLPSVTLGVSNQVAGKVKVSSAEDLSARVWVALGPEGLAMAGEVRDERVQLSTQLEHIHDDHVELWLALPRPELPPLAFANQFGEVEVPTAAACKDNPNILGEDPEACRAWWKEQSERRKQLMGAFVTQYGLLPSGGGRYGQKDTVGAVRYEAMEGGYRFEALIPPDALPRSAEAPLRNLRVMVDLVDNDGERGRLESFLSSSKGRKYGEPATFHAVKLATPLRFGAWPELLERALKANTGSSYQPGPDVRAIQVWYNPVVGYQYAPESPSPEVKDLDLSRMESLGRLGEVELLSVPAQVDWRGATENWLVTRRGQTLLDTQNVGQDELRHTARAPGLHILRVSERTQHPLGTGACGACPVVDFTLVKMDAQGRLSKPQALEGTYSREYGLAWEATADLSRIEVYVVDDMEKKVLVVRHTLDPKTGGYRMERFPHPGQDEGEEDDTAP